MDTLIFLMVALFAGILGNYMGDQATLRDCATKNAAQMFGGGTIECTVKKESTK